MKEYQLSDLIEIKHGYAFDGEHIVTEDNGVVLVTPGNFKIGGGFQEEKCKFFNGEIPEEYVLSSGDYIVTMTDLSKTIDTLGYSAIVPSSKTRTYLHNQRIGLIKFISDECDPDYIYYLMQTHKYQRAITNTSTGATVHHTSPSKIRAYKFFAPDLEAQKRVARALRVYDDLIENNQKQIKLLEEAAQRLYKEWFVDLRFPGHENTPIIDGIPQGWGKASAESFFEITIGKTPPRAESQWFTDMEHGIPWVSISDMGSSSAFLYETSEGLTSEAIKRHNVKIIPSNTVLLSFKLTVGRVAITTTEMCTNEAIAHFRMEDPVYREYVYCYLKDYHYDSLGSTSSISKAVNSKIIKAMPFVIPNYELVSTFSKIAAPIFDQIKNKQKACLKLKRARDRLLPKFMSGELEV